MKNNYNKKKKGRVQNNICIKNFMKEENLDL